MTTRPEPVGRAAELAMLSPRRAAFQLAWPGMLENLVRVGAQTLVFVFVGRLGAESLAALGVSLQFVFLLFPVWSSLGISTIALVARRMGSGDPEQAAEYARQALLLGVALSIAAGAAFVLFAEDLLSLIGTAPEVALAGRPFLQIVGGANVFATCAWISLAALRGAGDTRTPLVIVLVTSALGVPAIYVLLNTFGLAGAGVGTVATEAARFGWAATVVARGGTGLRLSFSRWRFDWGEVRTLLHVGVPASIEQVVISVGLLLMTAIAVRLGTTSLAAHNVLGQVESLSYLPLVGFSTATSALVGQALGMRDPDRGERAAWASAQTALLWTGVAGLAFVLFAEPIMSVYSSDSDVVASGAVALRILGVGQPAQGLLWVMAGALRGAGDTPFPLKVSLLNWFVIRLPGAVLFGVVLGFGLVGIWGATALDYFVRASLLTWRVRSRAWARLRY